MKIEELFEGYIENCRRLKKMEGTIRKHENNIKTTIGPILGSRELDSLRPVDAALLVESGNARGISMARASLVTFRRILRYARECGYVIPFDIEDIELPPPRRLRDTEALSVDDINEIRRALLPDQAQYNKHFPKKDHWKHDFAIARTRCLFEFLLHTGLRLSEALEVNRDQLNFETNEMRVKNIKTGEWATVYLFGCEPFIQQYLALRADTEPALFVSASGCRLSYATAQSCLKRIKKMIGLKKNLNHHIFRRTFVTMLLLNGCDPRETQRLARHRSLHTTLMYYYKLDDGRLKPKHQAVMEKI